MVEDNPVHSVGGSSSSTHLGSVAETAGQREVPSRPVAVASTRLALGQQELVNEGYSERVAQRVVATQAKTTLDTYDGRWKRFAKYCVAKGCDPFKASSPLIADFLTDLFEEGKATSTIDGYKSAISSTLKHTDGTGVGKHPVLTDLLANMRQQRPVKSLSTPPWDLKLVLKALKDPPFEPMEDAELQFVTWKTLFLVLLASGGRRGEVHALEFESVKTSKDGTYVILKPHVGFLSKTHIRTGGASKLDSFIIKSIAGSVDSDSEGDSKLCPVRALRTYLSRTRHLRDGKKLLFISFQPGHKKDIVRNTISGWIRKLILYVYKNADEAHVLSGTQTHAIRGMAASLAYRGGTDMEELMRACHWTSETTFTNFYLKDISVIRDNLSELGPLSVAQAVVRS